MTKQNIDNLEKDFFKKSLSVGHANVKYKWNHIMVMILSCVRSLESFEEGANAPSSQTLRDRLNLDGDWLEYFHSCMWLLAIKFVKRFKHLRWSISIDEKYVPFFGNRKKLNEKFIENGFGKYVFGYRAKTPGATGSFNFLVISLCCGKIRIPIAINMMTVGQKYKPWLKLQLQKLLKLVPNARVLADRGFGKATWFHVMLDELNAKRVIRIPLRAKRLKKKVEAGKKRFQFWMTNDKTKEKALLNVRVVYDDEKKAYLFATTEEKANSKQLLNMYLERWDIENIFKDGDRVWLKTSSVNPKMRLFGVVLSFFLFALWQAKRTFLKKNDKKPSLRYSVKLIIDQFYKLYNCEISILGILAIKPP